METEYTKWLDNLRGTMGDPKYWDYEITNLEY